MPLAYSAQDFMWIALSVFLMFVSVGLLLLLFRLAETVGRLGSFIQGLELEVLPVINRVGGTVERVNVQLDKVDQVTDSAVGAAASVDTAMRAVTLGVTRPVQKISAVAAGLAHGTAALRAHRNWRGALEAGRDAARRRERDVAEELARGSGER